MTPATRAPRYCAKPPPSTPAASPGATCRPTTPKPPWPPPARRSRNCRSPTGVRRRRKHRTCGPDNGVPDMEMTIVNEDETRLNAVRGRDTDFDGKFFYAVLTTGVFCYPSCAARPARPENLRFFDTREAAASAGYRPCRRCRPDLAPRAARRAEAVAEACRAIEQGRFNPAQAGEAGGLGQAAFARL